MSVLSWIIIYVIVGVLIYLIIYLLYPARNITYNPTPLPTLSPKPVEIVKALSNPSKGNFLTDSNGMTLYIFDRDSVGVSNCSGNCVATWPIFSANIIPSVLPENITVIQRADGLMQYAWKGMPLYYYISDKNPGETTGDGFNGIWHLVKP